MIIEHDFNDAADWGVQEAPDHAALMDTTADYLQERWKLNKATAEDLGAWIDAREELASESAKKGALRIVVSGLLLVRGNPFVHIYSLAFALGMNRQLPWATMTRAAQMLGVTKAAISKGTNKWADLFGINRSVHMKAENACEKYSEVQKSNKHWRRKQSVPFDEPLQAPWETDVPAPGTENDQDENAAYAA